jgi:GNAT superfamily N-acetyltransferase
MTPGSRSGRDEEMFTTMTATTTWQVTRDLPTEEAYAALAGDRRWNGYSIADLAPATRPWTQIALGRDVTGTAACLFYQHPAFNSLIPDGDPAGVAAILAEVASDGQLPRETYILAQESHFAALETVYTFPHGRKAMLRMAVDRATFRAPDTIVPAARLGEGDLAALTTLYANYADTTFTPDQLAHGVFYGVREGERLVAAGGTHVVAAEYGLAAVGNIFVLPAARGRGHGAAITAAIVGTLLAGPCRDVILNVAAENAAAQTIYRRLGFVVHCPYNEARAIRRDDAGTTPPHEEE